MFWSILAVAALCLLQLAQAQMKASTCDVDSSMELFLEPFARRVDELNKYVASDLLYFGFGYFHDLREMLVHYGWFPTDAHPGNLLYNMTLCGRPSSYWNDLGRTSSDGRLDGQIRESIQQFIDFERKCLDYTLSPDELSDHTQVTVPKDDVNRVLSHMRVPHASESYVDCFSAVVRGMHDEIMSSFTTEFRTMLWLRIGSSSRVVVSDMNVRLAGLKKDFSEFKSAQILKNAEFEAKFQALDDKIRGQKEQIQALNDEFRGQKEQIQALNEEFRRRNATLEILIRDFANRHRKSEL